MDMAVEVDTLVCSVWMNLVLPKVEFFMWLALLGKLNTKEKLCKKGILFASQSSCTFCSSHIENLDHVLLNCPFSWRVWVFIAKDMGQDLAIYSTFNTIYESWLAVQWRSKRLKKIWISIVFAVAWSLWMVRNEIIFHQKDLNFDEVCHSIKWKVAGWAKAWKERLPYKVEDIARNFSSIPALLH